MDDPFCATAPLLGEELKGNFTYHIDDMRLIYCYSEHCKELQLQKPRKCDGLDDTIVLKSFRHVKKKYDGID